MLNPLFMLNLVEDLTWTMGRCRVDLARTAIGKENTLPNRAQFQRDDVHTTSPAV
jgi:hypothetical protein